ncbi:MAG: tRNA uridine-5-carboxymethylaminomethyl(34) synthesis enzyme MnmG [Clostridiales bacterium]|nr:tRNA uridine-5-carboxymethylaminomethyl(34) synthesis enzyme MnmG [Clostridiales bacterium]
MSPTFSEGSVDAVVIGAGHAGCEAALALARTGQKTVMLTLNLDSIGFMPCNPSVGGTAKGHLVREIDALGGEMGVNADKTALQIRMLNRGKGAAVQSLRAQTDKNAYHTEMKRVLEHTENLRIVQGEAAEILTENGHVTGVRTTYGGIFHCRAAIVCTGVYLNAETITGDVVQQSGPNGFSRATALTQNLIDLGYRVRRFKTGTPARLDGRTVDYSKMQIQEGETDIFPFSFLTDGLPEEQTPCYLTYTNEETHKLILENLDRAPLYNGLISSTGPRYCPSIETKVVRFRDKERHQLFLEPEGADTTEIYVQGLSTSLPHDLQKQMYRTVKGLENCEIVRYAYAIEYDCIDTLDVLPTLESKKIKGLYTAGQINGTSGYEEAAAQGLMAGLNASLSLRKEPPLVLRRDQAYIGVLIDDLVTKGTDEPYRMMTSRAEFRLSLRQDNADLRLTEIGYHCGLVTEERMQKCRTRAQEIDDTITFLNTRAEQKKAEELIAEYGYPPLNGGVTYADLMRRGIPLSAIMQAFSILTDTENSVLLSAETQIRYTGYLEIGKKEIEKAKKMEEKQLPPDIDYEKIDGLRLEAREKLSRIRPLNLGQAERISGVNPADIAVLMIYLSMK